MKPLSTEIMVKREGTLSGTKGKESTRRTWPTESTGQCSHAFTETNWQAQDLHGSAPCPLCICYGRVILIQQLGCSGKRLYPKT